MLSLLLQSQKLLSICLEYNVLLILPSSSSFRLELSLALDHLFLM